MANKSYIKEAALKQENGSMAEYFPIGVSFEDVVNSDSKHPYSLKQFFDNYLDFMEHTSFVHMGPEMPKNSHVALWIDTLHNNRGEVITQ